jgi:hypothetical protein
VSEKRTKRFLGEVKAVLCYRGDVPVRMMMVHPGTPLNVGEFCFYDNAVHFDPQDAQFKKFIVYESVEQVQRTTRGKTTVKLRP